VVSVPEPARLQIRLHGAVQGVGFRPFVFRLATQLALHGWVTNSPQGVSIEVEGPEPSLRQFLLRLEAERPPHSFIQGLESSWLDPAGYGSFEIRPSESAGARTALVLPDIATCPDCLREILDPANRRYRYPFTNCTHCGPRFSIIEALPYDRANTSMKRFTQCPLCQTEYDNPLDRRFHAQPNACPACGPHLELWDFAGTRLSLRHEALLGAAQAIRQGRILALKGLGGFHLMVAAGDDKAVQRLRERKRREEKPFALMFPSIEQIKACCQVDELEERLLRSPESPIVLLRRRSSALPASVAPGNPYLGVMLPYTPLHHLLLAELGQPLVATSGNLSDEPICIDEHEALSRLGGIADCFLVHDRPIVRHVDDSIARIMLGRELLLRRARGYAPLPVLLPRRGHAAAEEESRTDVIPAGSAQPAAAEPPVILAVGAHLKNTVALAAGAQVFISQHIGDLENEPALAAFHHVIDDLQKLHGVAPALLAADAHPDYLSTRFARRRGLPVVNVQHHYAHVLACMAENELAPPVLGVAWDGTGYGLDGTIWGGEFLKVDERTFQRVGHLRTFPLPGGERAVKEPRRVALGILHELFGDAVFAMNDLAPLRAFQPQELSLLRQTLAKRINSPLTSSVGRLFDAVASLAGLRQTMRFEGQAAMELEFALEGIDTAEAYPLPVCEPRPEYAAREPPGPAVGVQRGKDEAETRNPASKAPPFSGLILDWAPLVRAVLAEVAAGSPVGLISARFHNALVEAVVEMARRSGERRVVLTGGCFQNKYLAERAVHRLQEAGFRPYWHQRVPPNDGGVALGQAVAAAQSH
jgi:hydrogenase maturation protein HypF